MSLGNNIMKRRNALGMTQSDLADKLHVTKQYISALETGEKIPNVSRLVDLSEILDVSIDWLVLGNLPERDVKPMVSDSRNYNYRNNSGTEIDQSGCVWRLKFFSKSRVKTCLHRRCDSGYQCEQKCNHYILCTLLFSLCYPALV